ncbi:uncharacterized protein Z520_08580 [Fonsecaea multimorphosa CBS 102226]|uniref:Uncharacterized protein n=1 Tax=Fonsecaea multimorphosa CBS 102226 TaxID=1442371 RepID=A0A0D2JR83_9EURO|nr:uncharacterized protein Z520_08580 [Fonsecaea multimorphosa CBS 102226]KIX95872.1 hypothetical protein Z520_08580 [Fonsecaea multimorphosa CBS 102226]
MLARATNTVHICLQCQRNLARASLNPSGAAESGYRRGLRRWQSVAAHQLAHEEVGGDHDDNTKPSLESDIKRQPTTPSWPQPRRRNFRNWKPKPTAQLGVNSLGQPTEVLLLPTRDRRIPQVPQDEGKEKMLGSTLQESIALENVPLNRQRLAENIEQVRSLVGKMRGQLEEHEWTTLKRHLQGGFEKKQMRRYIRLRKSNGSFPRDIEKYNKRELIKYLVEEVWGFTIPMQDEPVAPTTKESNRESEMIFALHESVRFDHLLMNPSQPLKRIAQEWDVQIDVYPEQFKIRTRGAKTKLNKALQEISAYAKKLGQIAIQLTGTLGAMYRDPATREYSSAYLKSIQRKYQGLSIGMDEQCIRIVHLNNPRGADQARREILLSVPTENSLGNSLIWPRMDLPTTSHQPFPTPLEFPALLHHSQWLRLVSTSQSSQTSNDGSGKDPALAPLLQGLRDAFDPASRTRKADNRQELYYDVTVKFGQALMQDFPQAVKGAVVKPVAVEAEENERSASVVISPAGRPEGLETGKEDLSAENQTRVKADLSEAQKNTSTAENNGPTSATTLKAQGSIGQAFTGGRSERPHPTYETQRRRFVGGGPFLAQHLALMEPWIDLTPSPSTDIDKTARAILRLELSPVPDVKDSPTFEIFVSAGKSAGQKRPRLQIVRVSAIHQEKHLTVLCPDSHMDIQLTQQLKRDLSYPGSSEAGIVHSLVTSLRSYINNASSKGSSDWVFPPFVALPVHHDLREAHKRTQRAVGQDETQETPSGAETAGEKKPQRRREYILRSVDVVDIDSRLFSVESTSKSPKTRSDTRSSSKRATKSTAKFCLDHVTYTGAAVTRQELRLAERPLLCPPTLTEPDLPMLVKAALDLVKRLSNNPVKTQSPSARKTS